MAESRRVSGEKEFSHSRKATECSLCSKAGPWVTAFVLRRRGPASPGRGEGRDGPRKTAPVTVPKHLTHESEPSAFSVAVLMSWATPRPRHHGSRGSWLSRIDCSRAAEMPPNVDKDHTGVLLARHTLKIKEEASCFLFCFSSLCPA